MSAKASILLFRGQDHHSMKGYAKEHFRRDVRSHADWMLDRTVPHSVE